MSNYPMALSSEDKLVIKNEDMYWVCKGELVEGSEEMSVRQHDHLSNTILSRGGVTFLGWHINLVI